eukprot:11195690-Lingulodinium_polyedra.AAC.1
MGRQQGQRREKQPGYRQAMGDAMGLRSRWEKSWGEQRKVHWRPALGGARRTPRAGGATGWNNRISKGRQLGLNRESEE